MRGLVIIRSRLLEPGYGLANELHRVPIGEPRDCLRYGQGKLEAIAAFAAARAVEMYVHYLLFRTLRYFRDLPILCIAKLKKSTTTTVPGRGTHIMSVSNVSPAAANLHSPQTASKPVQQQQVSKPAAPPVVKPADADGDRDGSGINVKA